MSIATLFNKNSFDLNCGSLNCETINNIKQSVITNDNMVGDVLSIKSINPNELEFKTIGGGGDGATVPFILTGNNVNALKVEDSSFDPVIRIDTVDNEVHLSGLKNFVEGVDDINKFSVLNSSDPGNPCLNVDTSNNETTINGKLLVSGVPNRIDALEVVRENGNIAFQVDTLNKQIGLNINQSVKRGFIKFLDTPEEIYPGFNSSAYMTLDSDIGGPGNANFVGYIAKNGPNSMLNVVNNNTAGLFFNTTASAGIQTTALNLNLTSFNPSGSLTSNFNSQISLIGNGCELNIGGNGGIKADKKVLIQDSSVNNLEQFAVKDVAGNTIFQVDTQNDAVNVRGNDNSGAKLAVYDANNIFVFLVDTNNDLLRMGSSLVNQSEIYLRPETGLIEIVGIGAGIFDSRIRCQHTGFSPSGGTLTMSAYRDNSNPNKLESIGASGLTISSDSIINMSGTTEFTTIAPKTTFAPLNADDITNKAYVDNYVNSRVSFFSMVSNSPSANEISPLFVNLLGGTFSPNSTLSVPANNFVVGDSFTLTISGSCNFNGTPPNATIGTPTAKNLTLTLLSNAVVLNTLVVPTRNTGLSSFFEIEVDFTIRSIGVSGSIVNSFEFTYQIPSTTSFEGTRSTTIGTIDTTISNTLTCVATLDTGYSSASIQAFMAVLRKTK